MVGYSHEFLPFQDINVPPNEYDTKKYLSLSADKHSSRYISNFYRQTNKQQTAIPRTLKEKLILILIEFAHVCCECLLLWFWANILCSRV